MKAVGWKGALAATVLGIAWGGGSLPDAARAATLYLSGPNLAGGALSLNTESYLERRFASTIAQQHDFSCGSAALATLLTYDYKIPISEEDIFKSMIENGDKDVIAKSGFSLLDLKNYLARNQVASEGFRAPLAKLQEVKLPAVVLVTVRGYNHFVVVQGIRDGRVLISDPAAGSRTQSIPEFEKQWSGVFFLILDNVEQAQVNFNDPKRWAAAPQLPFNLVRFALDRATLAIPAFLAAGRF